MRILMMLDWNRGHGGAEAYAAWLRDGLREAGDDVRLLTSSVGTAGDGTADYVAFGSDKKAAQALLQIVNPSAVLAVGRALRDFRPDVAWVNMFALQLSPAAVLALGTLPKVLLVSDYKVICPIGSKLLPDGSLCAVKSGWACHRQGCVNLPHWLRDQPRYALIRAVVRRADRVIACSAWIRNHLAQEGIPSEVSFLPVVSPTPGFIRRPSPDPTFLYFGRLEREKGVDQLLRAFGRLHAERPAARLRIAGHGSQQEQLVKLSSSLGLDSAVQFLGWLSLEQLERHLAEAWASVAPSLWAEPQGLVAVEAIVRGVPVIASSPGGLAEIVEDGQTGMLFPRGDERALLDCLRAVCNDAVFPTHVLAPEAVEKAAERFSLKRHIQWIRRVFQEIAGT